MNLQDELQALSDQFRASAPAEVVNTLEHGMQLAAESTSALGVGDVAPSFALPNASGSLVRSDELLASGPVVVSFYRGGWCPFCNLELNALQKVLPEIRALGASLVAISPESPDQSLSTSEKQDLEFHVLSDIGGAVGRSFGLRFSLDGASKEIYNGFGIDLPTLHKTDDWELPIPGTYVIRADGLISYAHVDADYRRRPNPDDVVTAVQTVVAELPQDGVAE